MMVVPIWGLLSVASGPARAQERAESLFDRDRNVSVTEREHPEYAAEGIQRGAFLFTPTFAFGLGRADNVFAASQDAEGDIVVLVNPGLDVRTTWSRHELTAATSVTRRQFFNFSNESVWNWELEGAGRFDIRRDASLNAALGFTRLTEDRTEAGSASRTREPIGYDRFDALAGSRWQFNRVLVRSELSFSQFDYDDQVLFSGAPADQDFRDYTRYEAMVRSDYAISPDTAIFGRVRVNDRDYDLVPPDVLQLRDSSGYTFDTGFDIDLGGLARGLLGIGYTSQDYADAGLESVEGISVDTMIEWFPTQLTTVTVQASRDVREAPFTDAAGYFSTQTGARVDHELRRNVILSAGVQFNEDDYQSINRLDERVTVDIGMTYVLNRWLGVRLGWTHIDQDRGGADAGRSYTQNSFGFTLVRP